MATFANIIHETLNTEHNVIKHSVFYEVKTEKFKARSTHSYDHLVSLSTPLLVSLDEYYDED